MLTSVNNENPSIDKLQPVILMVRRITFYFLANVAKLLRTVSMQHHQL